MLSKVSLSFPSHPFPVPLPCPALPSPPSPSPPSLPLSFTPPLSGGPNPLIAARRSGGVLKLPPRVRAEPGRQAVSGEF